MATNKHGDMLVFFRGRRTGTVVYNAKSRNGAITRAREQKVRGSDRVSKVRMMTEQESAQARSGKWVRTGPNGEAPDKRAPIKGQGPTPKAFKSRKH